MEAEIESLSTKLSSVNIAQQRVDQFKQEQKRAQQIVLSAISNEIDKRIADESGAGHTHVEISIMSIPYKGLKRSVFDYHLPLKEMTLYYAQFLIQKGYSCLVDDGPLLIIEWDPDGPNFINTYEAEQKARKEKERVDKALAKK